MPIFLDSYWGLTTTKADIVWYENLLLSTIERLRLTYDLTQPLHGSREIRDSSRNVRAGFAFYLKGLRRSQASKKYVQNMTVKQE